MRSSVPFVGDVIPYARLGFAMARRMVGSRHHDTPHSTTLAIQ